jgi:hypothetical protein
VKQQYDDRAKFIVVFSCPLDSDNEWNIEDNYVNLVWRYIINNNILYEIYFYHYYLFKLQMGFPVAVVLQ